MPNVNRRGFLQLLGATSAAPLLPVAPAKAAIAQTSPSKALWTSLYAKAGSQAEFIGLSRNMGLSSAAIQGVSARTIGVRVAASSLAQPIAETPLSNQPSLSSEGLMKLRGKVKDTLEKYFTNDDREAMVATEPDLEENDAEEETELNLHNMDNATKLES